MRGAITNGRAALKIATVGLVALALLPLLAANASAGSADTHTKATSSRPAWTITSVAQPTNFAPGDHSGLDQYYVTATNTGGAPTTKSPITVTDRLPSGLKIDSKVGVLGQDDMGNTVNCKTGPPITCTDTQNVARLQPGQVVVVTVPVVVASHAPAKVTNRVGVSGGGALSASTKESTAVSRARVRFAFQHVDGWVTTPSGAADTQAGSHPWGLTTTFNLTTVVNRVGEVVPAGSARDLRVVAPQGVLGNPTVASRCTAHHLASYSSPCPKDSQIGVVAVYFAGTPLPDNAPVYNMVPPPGMPAQLGFHILTTNVYIDANVRPGGNYALTASLHNIPQALQLSGSTLTLWGVPGNRSHDMERCAALFSGACSSPAHFKGTLAPFVTLPTACAGPQKTTFTSNTWQLAGRFASASFLSHDTHGHPVGATGCRRLHFTPKLTAKPSSSKADSPAGLTVDLRLPSPGTPKGLVEAQLKDATVTLPRGVSVAPPAAEGRKACSEKQIGLKNSRRPACPAASAVGSVRIDTPLLRVPVTGHVYLAQQDKNPFHSLLALYVAGRADGVLIKLAGHVVPNPHTGQLTTTFSNTPQLPFSDFRLTFYGGPRAALAMPAGCGTYTATSSLKPWSGASVQKPSSKFKISTGCVSGFKPSFQAGIKNHAAGAYTPFLVSFSRTDRDQYLSGLSLTLPEGVLAKLAGVKHCTRKDLSAASHSSGRRQKAHPSCPAGSLVGHAEVASGAGPSPLRLSGKVYLTGRYEGAPYGLAVVVPAVAGPFDLGTVVVRQALYVNPYTAQVKVVSDPLPQIIKGIPIRTRSVHVALNRSRFTLNATSCKPASVTGTLTSALKRAVQVSAPIQIHGCPALRFRPSLQVALTGQGQTRSGDHPTLISVLTQPQHEANVRSAKVTLPLSLALDPKNSQHVCLYRIFKKVRSGPVPCPKNTIIGSGTVITPVLSKPLTGKLYLVQGIKIVHGHRLHTLPILLLALRGQVSIDLAAQTSVSRSSELVTTFPAVPDAPVSKFTLRINGGRRGILVVTGNRLNICRKPQIAHAALKAQNGKSKTQRIKMSTPCGKRP